MPYEFFRYLRPITNGVECVKDGQQLLNITHSTNVSHIYGGEAAGDDLELHSNTSDAYSRITCFGGAGFYLQADNGEPISFIDGSNGQFITVRRQAGRTRFIHNMADEDLHFEMSGTGVLRFGNYAAIVAETLQGYVTIKDTDGNSRKLGVVA